MSYNIYMHVYSVITTFQVLSDCWTSVFMHVFFTPLMVFIILKDTHAILWFFFSE